MAAFVVVPSPFAAYLGVRLRTACLSGPGAAEILLDRSDNKYGGQKRDVVRARPWTKATLGFTLDAVLTVEARKRS